MRALVALSLAVCALAATPAAAAPDPSKWADGELPPGQAKKVEEVKTRANIPVVDEVAQAVDAVAQPVTQPVAEAVAPVTTAATAAAAAVSSTATPAATTATPAPKRAATPAKTTTRTTASTRSATRARSRAAARRRAFSGTRSRTTGTSERSAARTTRPAATRRPAEPTVSGGFAAQETAPEPKASAKNSGIERTVVQVFDVVPTWLLVALCGLATVGLMGATAAVAEGRRARWLEEQRLRLVADVGVLQSALLPELPAEIAGAPVSAAYRPAEGLAAGGDFYDAFALPDGNVAVLIGDVAGHGRDVVPLTGLVRYSLRAYLEAGLSPRATLQVASNVLASQVGGRMVTVAIATFDPTTGRLTVACAGHWPPLLRGVAAKPVTACSSPPIGAGVPTGRRQTTIGLPAGAAACFHTDGLADAQTGADRLGPDGVARDFRALGSADGAHELLEAIVAHSDHQPDDMAACVLRAPADGVQCAPLHLEELEVDAAALRGGRAARFLQACGVSEPDAERALLEAGDTVERAGTAVIEARIGTLRSDAYVSGPATVALTVARELRAVVAA